MCIRFATLYHSIILYKSFFVWLKDEMLFVTKAMLFFFSHPQCCWHCCHCHLNHASLSGERVKAPCVTLSVIISNAAPQSLPPQNSAAALTCGRGPWLECDLTFQVYDMVLLAACICAQGRAGLRKVSEMMWHKGHETGGWCLFTK